MRHVVQLAMATYDCDEGERKRMQLTTRETCQVLGVTETTIKRWIKQMGLPAHHVAGQYRFNRTEVLEWATAHQIKVSLEIFDQDEAEDEPAPSLADALDAGG